jgi:hypothetical protein
LSISDTFKSRGILSGGVLLLKPDDALDLVEEARARAINVLGIDAFFASDSGITPSMEFSRSYSDEFGAKENNHVMAIDHITRFRDDGLHFEVVLDED